jgi:hypothetical protein
MVRHDTRLAILRGCVDITPSSKPDRALSALTYGLKPICNLSQSCYGRTPIACAHTTGKSNTHLSQVSYRNLLIYQYKQECKQSEYIDVKGKVGLSHNLVPSTQATLRLNHDNPRMLCQRQGGAQP